MASIKFKNVYIKDYYSIVGPIEKESQIKNYDLAMDDYYFKEKTFELAEIKMQQTVIDNLLARHKMQISDFDILIGGDLSNQISITNYNAVNYNIPFLGIYAACATFCESLIVGANLIENGSCQKAMLITSSHNLNAEKQFRYPVEYGAPKPHTATFTSTGAISTMLTKNQGKIKIESATIGRVIELGIKDANNLGAVMAPAAAATLQTHLVEMKRDLNYYDLILTGDLGCIGSNILKEFCATTYNLKLKKYLDAGCELFLKSQDTFSGGSGPACLPLVLYNKILKQKKYRKILIIATGALHSVAMVNQKQSIPAIAHAVSLEVLS